MSFLASANDCENSLTNMIKNGDVEGQKLQKFLNLQAGITLHRLAYASLRHSRSEEQFRVEETILDMVKKVESEKKNDPAFLEVSELFNHSENKLSRTALAKVLPHIKDIINEQSSEQSSFKRKYFNIGLSDVRMLAILAEKEAEEEGQYIHAQFMDSAYDQSILNFTKIINSSVRNAQTNDKEHILNTMERRLDELYRKALELLKNMGLPEECISLLQACVVRDGNQLAIDDSFLNLIGKVIKDSNTINLHDQLRYNDVWLHVNSKVPGTITGAEEIEEIEIKKEEKPLPAPEIFEFTEQSDEEVVRNYLVQRVLDNTPYLFSRSELEENFKFTKSLANAIDQGVLTKKGKERTFTYQGVEYFLPEMWNSEYSLPKGLGGRAGKAISKRWNRFFRFDKDVDVSHIPEDERDSFLTTLNDQLKDHEHAFAFEFKDKLYDIKTGKPIKKGVRNFLKKYKSKSVSVANEEKDLPLSEIAKEIKEGNHSYVKEGKVFHISGAPVDLELESERARKKAMITNAVDESPMEFPSKEKLKKLSKDYPVLTLKLLADRKRAKVQNGQVFDMYSGRSLTSSEASQVLVEHRRGVTPSFQKRDLQAPKEIINRKVAGILNYGNPIEEANGWVPHQKLVEENKKIQAMPQKQRVVKHFLNNEYETCSHMAVVDKVSARLEVVKKSDDKALVVYSAPIQLGSKVGDERNVLYKDSKYNGKTGAGVFSLKAIADDGVKLVNPRDPTRESNFSIGQSKSNIENMLSKPRTTNGQVQVSKEDLENIKSMMEPGCSLVVLPETQDVELKVVEGDLKLMPTRFDDFSLKRVAVKKSVNDFEFSRPTPATYKPIRLALTDERFDSKEVQEFLQTLEDEKRFIMEDTGLNNEQYNELAKLAFGIMGTESSFGKGDSTMGMNLYKFKESKIGQSVISLVKSGPTTAALMVANPQLAGTVGAITQAKFKNKNSRGLTQIKNVRSFFNQRAPAGDGSKRYSEITVDTLDEPRNAAIATMFTLASKYKSFLNIKDNHSGITDQNEMDYLYYLYMGSSGQVKEGSATPSHNPKVLETNTYASKISVLTRP